MALPPLTASRSAVLASVPLEVPQPVQEPGLADLAPPWPVLCAVLLGIVGLYSIRPTVFFLLDLWRTDPLKSIGAFVPPVSLALILRAWRVLGWKARGSWWGMAVLLPTVALVFWRDHAVLELVLSPSYSLFLPPHALVAFAYVSGTVLLWGGPALYRAALFPILLVFLVNPVPHVFSRLVDLPLQHASALTARGFAQVLGAPLTPGELYLMFTPKFGMFIAPGCNGIRGSVTMGLLALVAGYLYRFRLRTWVAAVGAAVLLGYVFNLLRLCALVLYYVVALHFPWLQSRAETADYGIGAVLFFGAAVLFFSGIQRFNPGGGLRPPPLRYTWREPVLRSAEEAGSRGFWLRLAAFASLAAAGSAAYARQRIEPQREIPDRAIFPVNLGSYALRRTWQEKLSGGVTIFDWAEYALPGGTSAVSVGVSPVLGAHDTLLCHTARGEDWLWHGALTLPTAAGPVSFSVSSYSDGATQSLEASTVCSGERCGQWSTGGRHFGLVYSRGDGAALLSGGRVRPIPVLLKVETPDAGGDPQGVRASLQAELRDFLENASLVGLTRPYWVR